jgi:hypothetical protein
MNKDDDKDAAFEDGLPKTRPKIGQRFTDLEMQTNAFAMHGMTERTRQVAKHASRRYNTVTILLLAVAIISFGFLYASQESFLRDQSMQAYRTCVLRNTNEAATQRLFQTLDKSVSDKTSSLAYQQASATIEQRDCSVYRR